MTDRRDLRIPCGDEELGAWLYLPDSGPAPVVVMGHGLGGTKDMRLDAYADRFRAAGYACLVFDYRTFGESSGEPRMWLDVPRQREDWRTAVAFARTIPEVDESRVVVWGSSFGGGHVIVTAADDPSIVAAVSQCPFTDGIASGLAVPPVSSSKATVRAVRDLVAARRGREPVRVPVAGEPGSTALMVAPDALPGYSALSDKPLSVVPARVMFQILADRPGARAKDVRCPILFAVCDPDSVAPTKATLRHVRKAPRGEVRVYPYGHFEIYLGEPFERVVADQVAFLQRHVPI